MKRITLIVGHYGSGKTEVSVNMAINLKKQYDKVAIIDLDVANPYFRSRERQDMLEAKGIDVYHNSFGYDITEDMPAISAAIRTPLENEDYISVIDVGGDDSGARVLNQFKKYFLTSETEMLCVVNVSRPETSSIAGILNHIERIENETGMKITGIINNSHMLMQTEIEHIISGYRLCRIISFITGIPVVLNTCREDLVSELNAYISENMIDNFTVYPIYLYMRPKWLDR